MNLVPVACGGEAIFEGSGGHLVDAGMIGRMLYPKHKRPARTVITIYERNKDHFTAQDTMLLEVETGYCWSPDGRDMRPQFEVACPSEKSPFSQDMKGQIGPACPLDFRVSSRDMKPQFGAACPPGKTGIRRQKVRFFSIPFGMIKLCKFSRSPYAVETIERVVTAWQRHQFGSMLRSLPSRQPIACTEYFIKEIKRRVGTKKGNEVIKALFEGTFDGSDYYMEMEEIARMPDGHAKGAALRKEAERQGVALQTMYRRLKRKRAMLGLAPIPTKLTKAPRRTRADKGCPRRPRAIAQKDEGKNG